jgi:hypothetical protein
VVTIDNFTTPTSAKRSRNFYLPRKHGRSNSLENEGGFGSLVIFDGRTYHSVEDVDLDQVIDFSRPDGRLAAFVSLYSVM